MPGTIFGLPLSQQITALGRPMAGCKLYIYQANTTTPATAYQDYGLTAGLELPWPIEADGNGRIPQFWLNDGTYRTRLTDAAGTVQFDNPSVVALGPSSGESGGGGVDANAIFRTGDPLWIPVSGARSGFIRMNGRTFGSAISGAAERANADTEALFIHAWENFPNSLCAVSGGRGASAAADFAANKTITALDMRDRAAFGLDDMGSTALNGFSGITFSAGNGIIAGSAGGAATQAIAQANLPAVNFTVAASGNVTPTVGGLNAFAVFQGAGTNNAPSSAGLSVYQTTAFGILETKTVNVTGTAASGGSGTAIDKMAPFRLGTWYWKL